MNIKRDNIYVYLWEELNTVYVGRTVNPKSRHYQHRHIPTEKTYKFSIEHGVEHPKMIIIENDLSIEEGIEREKYWIKEYRENSPYDVLNRTEGGEVGCVLNLTDEEREKKRKKWKEEHKDEIAAKAKEYRERYKERIKIQKSKWKWSSPFFSHTKIMRAPKIMKVFVQPLHDVLYL